MTTTDQSRQPATACTAGDDRSQPDLRTPETQRLSQDSRPTETQRLDAFVDAAFAFAVTLLVVSGGAPPATFAELGQALLKAPAFAFGFSLIAMFWLGHRAFGQIVSRRDGVMAGLSLAIVFVALLYVLPLRMLAETMMAALSGGRLPGRAALRTVADLRALYVVYGVGFAALALLYAALYRRALSTGVVDPGKLVDARQWAGVWAILLLAAVLSIAAALGPWLGVVPWLPGMLYSIIPVLIGVQARLHARRSPA